MNLFEQGINNTGRAAANEAHLIGLTGAEDLSNSGKARNF